MVSKACKPRLCWVNTKEIEPGYVEPVLDEVLQVPGQTKYIGRGIQIVRGNYMRGRPHFLDSLNIRYLDDFGTEELPVNDSLHGSPRAVCADGWGDKFWTGPIFAYLKAGSEFDAKKMRDITLTAYRDAVDYLAYFRETRGSMIDQAEHSDGMAREAMKNRTGKVKGVRINCVGDRAGEPAREFQQVDVPRAHPIFWLEGDDPLDVAESFDESWAAYRYAGYEDATKEEAQNESGRLLQLSVSDFHLESDNWGKISEDRLRHTAGSLLVVDRRIRDLDVGEVQAVCRVMKEQIVPLLDGEEEAERQEVLDILADRAWMQ